MKTTKTFAPKNEMGRSFTPLATVQEITEKFIAAEIAKKKELESLGGNSSVRELGAVAKDFLASKENHTFSLEDFLKATVFLDIENFEMVQEFFNGLVSALVRGGKARKVESCYNAPLYSLN